MMCLLIRRLISRAEDRGAPLPGPAERHVARCEACREFARSTASLGERLAAEVPSVLDRAPETRLDAVFAAGPAGPARATGGTRRFRPRLVALRPVPAVAAALAVAAVALVLFFRVPPRRPAAPPSAEAPVLAGLRSIAAARAGFPTAIGGAEATLAGERAVLERSVLSTLEYLQAQLNIRIERRDPPKAL